MRDVQDPDPAPDDPMPPNASSFEPFGAELADARFLRRPNRFVVRARLDGGPEVRAHLPNPGRLEEILVPGRPLRLEPADDPGRKTDWSAVLARTPDGEGWVSLVTTIPNRLVGRAVAEGRIEELGGWQIERSEARIGGSRFDFLLGDGGRRLALEVKSVTLEQGGVGLFPDAVTERGTRHVRELTLIAGRDSWEAAVLFVAQRGDVDAVAAAPGIDPAFAETLTRARAEGVRALARRCEVTPAGVGLGSAVPVLDAERVARSEAD